MSDIGFALEAKSDQLNFDDIADTDVVITISDVQIKQGDQPVSVFFHGCKNRPWKPSKGMLRLLATAWGRDSSQWTGRSAMLYGDKSVRWAGKEIGGIRIKLLSDIPKNGISAMLTVARGKRSEFRIGYLSMEKPAYPQERFDSAIGDMVARISKGIMSIEQVVSKCQETGYLTKEQLQTLENAIPVNISED